MPAFAGMTFRGFRGRIHLGEGVESNEVRARGKRPPLMDKTFVIQHKQKPPILS